MADTSRDTSALVALRHELHAHAELAGREIETSRIIRRFIEGRQPNSLVENLGGFGTAAVYEGRGEGPSVMFRAEIDAVPVQEINDVDHRSLHAGVSHMCGHDGHASVVAGLAERLAQRPLERGRVVLLFQPAEESGFGARKVLDDERFRTIEPEWIFALHNLPREPFGEVRIRRGPFCAGSVGIIVELKGRTSHAAYPEQGRSPANAAAELVRELPGVAAAEDFGDQLARVTVVHARIGEPAFGTAPGEACVMATLRSDQEEGIERLRTAVVERAELVARSHELELSHSWADPFPVTENHPAAVEVVERVAEDCGIAVSQRDAAYPWSEDFGWYTRRFRGAIFGLGSGITHPALHSPDYDFPDALIPLGLDLFEGIIERLLE